MGYLIFLIFPEGIFYYDENSEVTLMFAQIFGDPDKYDVTGVTTVDQNISVLS